MRPAGSLTSDLQADERFVSAAKEEAKEFLDRIPE
jgi:hypothetical protein